jgi:CubicO group peptidase (beta-lactamase class C family)
LAQSDLNAELQSLLQNSLKSEEPGGALLVTKDGQIVFAEGYGVADVDTKEKITPNTLFNTGSVSKTMVANAILILAAEHRLSLDDPLTKYFDDFDHPEVVRKIRIKHLLSHTSGLPDLRKVGENPDFYLTAKDIENFEPLKRLDRLNFIPGERFEYSNPAYNGLALIIEQLTNQKWQEFVSQRIFEPSGMKATKITDGAYPESGVAHGYILEEGQYVEHDYGEVPTFAAAGNGGVWSSLVELVNYHQALKEHRFLTPELTKESKSVFEPINWSQLEAPHVGYSWFIGEQSLFGTDSFGLEMVYHTGSQGGFRAFYLSIPEEDLLFAGLFNRPIHDMRGLIFEGLKILERHDWLE